MNNHCKISRHAGMSLIELMVALVIGSILLAGLASVFFNSSHAQRELEKTGQLIENGRYAISLLSEDLRHAGYFGQFFGLDPAPAALPDPCHTATLHTNTIHMSQPMQGYNAPDTDSRPDISATSCGGFLTNDNLSPGSDILVIRRADTATVTGVMTTGNLYLQANSLDMNMYIGANAAPPVCNNAVPGTCKFPSTPGNTTVADTRQYHVHVYFIAPCSFGSGANGLCINTDPRQPTLKQLTLSTNGAPAFVITPLVEGIEYFQVEYGIDDTPSAIDPVTGQPGDGVPDLYTSAPTAAQWGNVVSARIHLLARSPRATDDYTDTKQYQLAGTTYGAFADNFKRHVYNTEIRPVNMSGRREIP